MALLRSSLSSLIYYSARWLGQKEKGVRILCYHSVSDEKKKYTTVPIQNFKDQIRFLSEEGYHTIGLNELIGGRLDEKSIVITFDDGYQNNYDNAFPVMKQFRFKGVVFCIAEKIGTEGYLNVGQIREMVEEGFEFGSHSLSHPELTALRSQEKEREIIGSKQHLEKELGVEIDFFCYPKGLYDEEVIEWVKKAGYYGACSNIPGTNEEGKNGQKINPYLLKRTEISSTDTLDDFKKKIAGAYDLMHKALHAVRGRP